MIPSFKLNSRHREAIEKAIVQGAMAPDEEDLKALATKTMTAYLDANYPQAMSQIETIGVPFLADKDKIRIVVDKCPYGENVVTHMELQKKISFPGGLVAGRYFHAKSTHKEFSGILEYIEVQEKVRHKKSDLRTQTRQILRSYATSKRLLEDMPEVEKLCPELFKPKPLRKGVSPSSPLPANFIMSLRIAAQQVMAK